MKQTQWILNPLEQVINKGAIAEAFVGQELIAGSDAAIKPQLFYWHREARSSNAEVDYLAVSDDMIIPIILCRIYLHLIFKSIDGEKHPPPHRP